ncbi:MAG: CsgG/HfaB family protein [Sphingobium sp.]|uniref:CsgG/HfaB family protein n=1 Tax=Sphingobium sp. TaxID=1912891 RepID=UPI0029A1923C|nr:CsgG/HfaB family protein [Sphingobium sp.]MDX3911612.1 CsgG/HfaB family protein [Sphingobium sp.]
MRHILTTAHILGITALAISTPATAQKMGKGGIGIDETSEVPRCDVPLGTIALVEDRTAAPSEDDIPAGLRAMIRMAEAQNGGGSQKIDPLPLLKLLTSQSNCFQVLDRGEGFDALQRERALAAGGTVANGNTQATLLAADYLLTARVLYSDGDAGGSGGGLGTMFPGAIGFKSKKLESQTMLTLVEVKTGLQKAVATGTARKKDISIIGGALTGSGIGALGGGYTSTDIGKITSFALLDAFRKLTRDAQGRMAPSVPAAAAPAPLAPPAASSGTAPATGASTQ